MYVYDDSLADCIFVSDDVDLISHPNLLASRIPIRIAPNIFTLYVYPFN